MISVDEYKGNPKYLRCLSCQKEGSEDNKIYLIGVGRVRTDMIINLCEECMKELKRKIDER